MTTRSMRRAERAASALVNGTEILDALKGARRDLVASAKQSRPPVAAVSGMLLERFGAEVKRLPVRQFIGLAVRAILEDAGFEVAYSGVRINGDPVFASGSVYRKHNESQGDPLFDDSLERMLRGLTPEQAARAQRILRLYFPSSQDEESIVPQKKRPMKLKSRTSK